MRPFQFAKMQKVRDFKIDFWKFSWGRRPRHPNGGGQEGLQPPPRPHSPRRCTAALRASSQASALPYLEIKHCLILWSGAATANYFGSLLSSNFVDSRWSLLCWRAVTKLLTYLLQGSWRPFGVSFMAYFLLPDSHLRAILIPRPSVEVSRLPLVSYRAYTTFLDSL